MEDTKIWGKILYTEDLYYPETKMKVKKIFNWYLKIFLGIFSIVYFVIFTFFYFEGTSFGRMIKLLIVFTFVFIFILSLALLRFYTLRKGLKIYQNVLIIPDWPKDIVVPFSKIECVFWNNEQTKEKDHEWIVFLVKIPSPLRKREIKDCKSFEKKFIYNLSNFKKILQSRVKCIDDKNFSREVAVNWLN